MTPSSRRCRCAYCRLRAYYRLLTFGDGPSPPFTMAGGDGSCARSIEMLLAKPVYGPHQHFRLARLYFYHDESRYRWRHGL